MGPVAAFLAWLTGGVAFALSVYLLLKGTPKPSAKFSTLFILNYLGATGIILTGDIFNLFVFLEITGITAYALAASAKTPRSLEGGMKYLVVGSISSTLYLIAVALVYAHTGTLNMAQLASLNLARDPLMWAAFGLALIGFAAEAEQFPMNGWAPDAYTGAPPSVASLFAGVTAKASVYALVRLAYTVFGFGDASFWLLVMGVITLLVAEGAALNQKEFKRALAYSSVGQMGLALVGFSAGLAPGFFVLLAHALAKPLAFLSLGDEPVDGLVRRSGWRGVLFGLASLSVMGLPPFPGFWAKLWVLKALLAKGQVWALWLVLLGALMEAAYYGRGLVRALSRGEGKLPGWAEAVPGAFLAAGLLALSFVPTGLYGFFVRISPDILDKLGYALRVLGGAG